MLGAKNIIKCKDIFHMDSENLTIILNPTFLLQKRDSNQ